jgi:hypothetical protein
MASNLGDILEFEVKTAGDEFLKNNRPSEEIRDRLDLSYRIEGLSVVVFEIRPSFRNPAERHEEYVAKTTFVKSAGIWKVFWMRADLKWHAYPEKPKVKTIKAFFDLVEEDALHCFFG